MGKTLITTNQDTPLLILGGQKEYWRKFLKTNTWYGQHCHDLRQLKQQLENKLGLIIIDLTHNDFSYVSLSSLISHFPKARWFAYIDKKQLDNKHTRLFISRFCLDYLSSELSLPQIYARILPQVNMLNLLQEDFQSQNQHANLQLLGESRPMLKLKEQIKRFAQADTCLLIQGEVGVGKTLVAKKIHYLSARRLHQEVVVNCEGLPYCLEHHKDDLDAIIEILNKKLKQAQGSTLILKNIEYLPKSAQSYILDCLSDHDLDKQLKPDKLNIRIIATTRIELNDTVLKTFFTPELIYRFNALHLHVPSLQDRISDLPILTQHFIETYSLKYHGRPQTLSQDALDLLSNYAWPGNIHELIIRIKHVVLMAQETEISKDYFDLPSLYFEGDNLKALRDVCEKEAIARVLNSFNGHVTDAAKSLSISRATMYRLIDKHHLSNLI